MAPIALKVKGNRPFLPFLEMDTEDELQQAWRVCTRIKDSLEDGSRLENLSWRLWYLQHKRKNVFVKPHSLAAVLATRLEALPDDLHHSQQSGPTAALAASTPHDVIIGGNVEAQASADDFWQQTDLFQSDDAAMDMEVEFSSLIFNDDSLMLDMSGFAGSPARPSLPASMQIVRPTAQRPLSTQSSSLSSSSAALSAAAAAVASHGPSLPMFAPMLNMSARAASKSPLDHSAPSSLSVSSAVMRSPVDHPTGVLRRSPMEVHVPTYFAMDPHRRSPMDPLPPHSAGATMTTTTTTSGGYFADHRRSPMEPVHTTAGYFTSAAPPSAVSVHLDAADIVGQQMVQPSAYSLLIPSMGATHSVLPNYSSNLATASDVAPRSGSMLSGPMMSSSSPCIIWQNGRVAGTTTPAMLSPRPSPPPQSSSFAAAAASVDVFAAAMLAKTTTPPPQLPTPLATPSFSAPEISAPAPAPAPAPRIQSPRIQSPPPPPLQPLQQRSRSMLAVSQVVNPETGARLECHNCGATSTPTWRRTLNGEPLCNACGLYFKKHHKQNRPVKLFSATTESEYFLSPGLTPPAAAYAVPTENLVCKNCSTTSTPLWRRYDDTTVLCNACGLYKRIHMSDRPINLKHDVFRKRPRKSPVPTAAAAAAASAGAAPSSTATATATTATDAAMDSDGVEDDEDNDDGDVCDIDNFALAKQHQPPSAAEGGGGVPAPPPKKQLKTDSETARPLPAPMGSSNQSVAQPALFSLTS